MHFPGSFFERSKVEENKEDTMADVPFGVSVEIEEEVFQKVMHWVNKSDHEVSGLGSVEIDEERNVFRVVDAILLDQENTMSTTDLDDEAVGKAMYEHHKEQKPGLLKWWWHSHVNMSVFWSGTDMSTIKKLGKGGWFVATVFNKSEETKSAFVQSAPIRLIAEDIPSVVVNQVCIDPWAEHREDWDGEYDEKVTEKKVTYALPGAFPNYRSSAVVVPKKSHVGFKGKVSEAVEVDENEDDETQAEERLLLLDSLFALHKRKKLTDEEFYAEIRALDEQEEYEDWEEVSEGVWRTEDGSFVDETGSPLIFGEQT